MSLVSGVSFHSIVSMTCDVSCVKKGQKCAAVKVEGALLAEGSLGRKVVIPTQSALDGRG